jgi:hypothetical protein
MKTLEKRRKKEDIIQVFQLMKEVDKVGPGFFTWITIGLRRHTESGAGWGWGCKNV